MMKHHYYKWCYLSRMLSANSWRTARSGMPTRARPAWRGGGSPSRRGGSGRMWSRGAVQRRGDVIDNFHCSADSVSQCEPVAVHHGHGTAAEVIPSECEFNYLLYGDSYLTEYFRFVGIYSLNTETRVGFPDNVNYVILWITVDYESSYPERNTRITRAEFLVRITTVNDGDGSLHDTTANCTPLEIISHRQ